MFGTRLRQLRKEHMITQTELAGKLGVSQQAVGKWETGRSSPDHGTLMQLADFFGVSLDSLLGRCGGFVGEVQPYLPVAEAQVPVVGSVRAGYGALAFEEDLGDEAATVKDPESYFYLVVKGDSMEPRIHEGDLALVRRQPVLDDGDLGVVIYGEGEGTLKRFLRKGNAVVLQPFNPAYEPIILAGEDLERLYIAGKVVETKARW
ncbi:XRE family transcriptional regulator [Ruminococcaceae bacterium OttesenSCG-928-I18]|nr:XRE family transcriptional regulator [Ruminococcaceae bacterium OttesenSCG-928-I18]